MENIIKETKLKMAKAVEALDHRFVSVRAGRANPGMLSGLMVDYYGTPTPISTISNITVPEARQLMIKPFDKSSLKDIERAIFEANLGISPTNNGEMIILTVPELTQDRRKDYVKQIKTFAEETKVALRNAREDARNAVKKADLPEDDTERYYNDIQDLINEHNKIVDAKTKEKENELMTI